MAPESAADFNAHATGGIDRLLPSPSGVTVYCLCGLPFLAHVRAGSRYYSLNIIGTDLPTVEKEAVSLTVALKR